MWFILSWLFARRPWNKDYLKRLPFSLYFLWLQRLSMILFIFFQVLYGGFFSCLFCIFWRVPVKLVKCKTWHFATFVPGEKSLVKRDELYFDPDLLRILDLNQRNESSLICLHLYTLQRNCPAGRVHLRQKPPLLKQRPTLDLFQCLIFSLKKKKTKKQHICYTRWDNMKLGNIKLSETFKCQLCGYLSFLCL